MGLFSLGKVNFKDCFMADCIIFSKRSNFTTLRSEFWQIMGVIYLVCKISIS